MSRGGWRFGAGRPAHRVKAEHCLRLDVRALAARGLLRRGGASSWRWSNAATGEEVGSVGLAVAAGTLTVSYRANGRPVDEPLRLSWTPCTFGGARPWLHCPCCGRRAAVLYLRSWRFVCRACGDIAYSVQSEDAVGRAWRRQGRLEARLGPHWSRPRGMHRTTYARLLAALGACEDAREAELVAFMDRMGLLPTLGG